MGTALICILITIFCLHVYSARLEAQKIGKVIVDVDAGGDDAIAISLALQYEARMKNDFQIIAITCVYGNTYEENVEQNVLKTLTMANRSDIPVYSGAKKPLLTEYQSTDFFGKDGFGDFQFDKDIIGKIDKSKYAAVALVELAKNNPGEVTLICLGPLTNIATAIALDHNFLNYLKNVYIMGSSVNGYGNAKPNVEFNFSFDPSANYMTLNSTKKPVFLFPWETTHDNAITLDWRNNVFGTINSELVEFLNKVERVELTNIDIWTPADAMIMAVALWPELVSKTILTHVEPIIYGPGKGSVIVDYTNKTTQSRNAIIIMDFDTKSFQQILVQYLG